MSFFSHQSQWILGGLLLITATSIKALESIPVSDSKLKQCIESIAQKKTWNTMADVTDIRCHSKSIASLKGLDAFANLESLSLHNNKLTTIDINFEALPRLKHLNLARNQLTQLELKNLTHLETLYVFGNKLSSIKLANLQRLKTLNANGNRITLIGYANLPELEKVVIFNNRLETINIHDLPAMTYMDCRENPMPDSLYDEMDSQADITFLHDGNAEDW